MKVKYVLGGALGLLAIGMIACSTAAVTPSEVGVVPSDDAGADGSTAVPLEGAYASVVDGGVLDASADATLDAKATPDADAGAADAKADGSSDALTPTCAFDVNAEAKVCKGGSVQTKADWAAYAGCTHITGYHFVYPTEVDTLSAMPKSIVRFDNLNISSAGGSVFDVSLSGMPENMHISALNIDHDYITKVSLPACMKADALILRLPKAPLSDGELQQICNASVESLGPSSTGVVVVSTPSRSSCSVQEWFATHKGCERRYYYGHDLYSAECADVPVASGTCGASKRGACQGKYLVSCGSKPTVAHYCDLGCVSKGSDATCITRTGASCGTQTACEGVDGACLAGTCGTSPAGTNCVTGSETCTGDTAVQCPYAGYPWVKNCGAGKCKDGWCSP